MNYLEIIEDYIFRPKTNYALMINGEWGNGKTYFVQNTVFPRLQEIGMKPIYITLNGVNTIDEINKEIFLATSFLSNDKYKRILETKAAKYVTQITKIALSSTSQKLGLGGSNDYSIDFEKLIDLNNIVLCFDDLERCKIDIVEIFGYINNFVEHDDVKTIIIGNEKEIKDISIDKNNELKVIASTLSLNMKQRKATEKAESSKSPEKNIDNIEIRTQISDLFNEQKQFDVVKEKLIGKTILYEPDFTCVIGQILKGYDDFNKEYYQFLKEQSDTISTIHRNSNRHNLRIIKQSLSDFLKIYSLLNSKYKESEFFDLLVTGYFVPALILSIEQKEGSIKSEALLNMESIKITQSLIMFKKKEWAFYNKYFNSLDFKLDLYHSSYICKYIATSLLEEENLLEEARIKINNWSEPNLKRNKSSIQKLMDDFLELENDEFLECVEDVLKKVKDGEYDLRSYARTFNYFESWFIDLISINIEELLEIFEKGIRSAKIDQSQNTEYFERFFIKDPTENQQKIQALIKEIESKSRNEWVQSEVDNIVSLLPDHVEKFIDRYSTFVKEPNYKEIFQFVNIDSFYEALKKVSNRELQHIRFMFTHIYNFSNLYEYFELDYENVIKLIECFSKDIKEVSGVRRLQYQVFVANLDDIAKRLKRRVESVL